METADLIKKIKKIEIKSKGISKDIFSGEYHSVFKGKGMAFSEVREYQHGDEIRKIDWNVTARFNHPYIKTFEEERELTVVLLVDVSSSESFGTQKHFKKDLIIEMCAVLAFSAIQNNDKIGLIFFSDKIEKFIPPKKGKTHILRIIHELLEFKSESKGTDINQAVRYMLNIIKKRSIVFILSDFMAEGYEESLKISARKHDTIAVKVFDKAEEDLPKVGLVKVIDSETGKDMWINTSSRQFRNDYQKWWRTKEKQLDQICSKNKIDMIRIRADKSYIEPLKNFFNQRNKRK